MHETFSPSFVPPSLPPPSSSLSSFIPPSQHDVDVDSKDMPATMRCTGQKLQDTGVYVIGGCPTVSVCDRWVPYLVEL